MIDNIDRLFFKKYGKYPTFLEKAQFRKKHALKPYLTEEDLEKLSLTCGTKSWKEESESEKEKTGSERIRTNASRPPTPEEEREDREQS